MCTTGGVSRLGSAVLSGWCGRRWWGESGGGGLLQAGVFLGGSAHCRWGGVQPGPACFLLGLLVVVPMAKGAHHVYGGLFSWLPLRPVCCFKVATFRAPAAVP